MKIIKYTKSKNHVLYECGDITKFTISQILTEE